MEDDQIVALFFSRSQRAITEMSAKYGGVCRKLAENILRDPLDAEECINDAYLAVWDTVPPETPRPLLTYLCRIVRNLALKRYHSNTALKRNSRYDVSLDELLELIPSVETAEAACMAKELSAALDRFLSELDGQSRVLFVRRYWFADSISDIAELLHMKRGQVSVRLSRTRKKLKEYLEKEGLWS